MIARLVRLGFIGIFVLLVVIQLLPIGRPTPNPATWAEPAWNSPETRALARRACFDCHSNETVWPAYSYVAPVSWLVARNVQRGRHKLNFSEFGTTSNSEQETDDIPKVFRRGSMPPREYLLLHPEARLTAEEMRQLQAGLEASLR